MVVMVLGDFVSPDGQPFCSTGNVFAFAQRPNIPGTKGLSRKKWKKVVAEFTAKIDGPRSYFVRWGVFGSTPEELKTGIDTLFKKVKTWQNIRVYSKDDMSDIIRINRRPWHRFGAMADKIREAGFDVGDPRPEKITNFIDGLFRVAQTAVRQPGS